MCGECIDDECTEDMAYCRDCIGQQCFWTCVDQYGEDAIREHMAEGCGQDESELLPLHWHPPLLSIHSCDLLHSSLDLKQVKVAW